MLPTLFILVAAAAVLVGLGSVWASLRAAFGGDAAFDLPSVQAESRRALEEQKAALLTNIRDLEFDHAGGKISQADFERLDGKLRAEAKRVLKLLDADVKPYRAKAEALLKAHLDKAGTPYRGQVVKDDAEEASETEASETNATGTKETKQNEETAGQKSGVLRCPSCDAVNDSDAAFCKKCGTAIEAETTPTELTASEEDAERAVDVKDDADSPSEESVASTESGEDGSHEDSEASS